MDEVEMAINNLTLQDDTDEDSQDEPTKINPIQIFEGLQTARDSIENYQMDADSRKLVDCIHGHCLYFTRVSEELRRQPRSPDLQQLATTLTQEIRFLKEFQRRMLLHLHDPVRYSPAFPEGFSTYQASILSYLQRKEETERLPSSLLRFQKEVNDRTRAILVDWMVDVQISFKLTPESLFLAVKILDSYLHRVVVPRCRLQLAGISALLVAAKFEEIYPPPISDFVYISDCAVDREQILEMERDILESLSFNISLVTPLAFLKALAFAVRSSYLSYTIAKYLMECFLLEAHSGSYRPSHVAGAALYAAEKFFQQEEREQGEGDLLRAIQEALGDPQDAIHPLAEYQMNWAIYVAKSPDLKSIQKKYSSKKFEKVSLLLNK